MEIKEIKPVEKTEDGKTVLNLHCTELNADWLSHIQEKDPEKLQKLDENVMVEVKP